MSRALDPRERRLLSRLLGEHVPSDPAEARHRADVVGFAARWPNPFDRHLEVGHLTGSAFIVDPAGHLLLTHHRRLDIWVQLGGHAEAERRADEVAMREAREESGLPDLRFSPRLTFPDGAPRLLDVDVHAIPARGVEPKHEHHDLRFLLETQRPELIVPDPSETRCLEWVTLAEARRRGDPGLRRAVDKLVAFGLEGPPGGGQRSRQPPGSLRDARCRPSASPGCTPP